MDLSGADVNVDLIGQPLPFAGAAFDSIVTQHLVEHLELESELGPPVEGVAAGLRAWRGPLDHLSRPGEGLPGLLDRGRRLNEYMHDRQPGAYSTGLPSQHIVNIMFHQAGLHRNLYDFKLLSWALTQAGFFQIERVVEADLLKRFPDFPPRNDDFETLCVRCLSE